MQNYSTTENANGAEFPGTGAPPDVNATVDPSEITEPTAAEPVSTVGADEPSMGRGIEAPATTSSNAAPAAASTNSVTSHPQSFASKPVMKVKGIVEMARTGEKTSTYWEPPFEVQEGSESSIELIIRRAALVRALHWLQSRFRLAQRRSEPLMSSSAGSKILLLRRRRYRLRRALC